MAERITLREALEEVPEKGARAHAGVCFYCRKHATRLEYDHFPLAYEFGGTTVVPCCLTCHDLKDRMSIMEWPSEMLVEAFEGLTPMAALLLSKGIRAVMRGEVPREDRMPPRDAPRVNRSYDDVRKAIG